MALKEKVGAALKAQGEEIKKLLKEHGQDLTI